MSEDSAKTPLPHRPILCRVSATAYVVAYTTATIAAHLSQLHQEFCPIYATITVAALLHMIVEWSRPADPPPPDKVSDPQVGLLST
jgi:hypothetical protein